MLEHGERRIQLPGNVNSELFLGKQTNDTAHIPLCVANPVAGVSIESDSKKSHKRLKKGTNYDNSLYPLFQTLIFCLCDCFLRL